MKINRQSAISKFNNFSTKSTPFLFIIDFQGENCVVEPLDRINSKELKFWVNGKTNVIVETDDFEGKEEVKLEKYPIDFLQYKKGFDYVQKNIFQGNSFLTNLTCETPISLNISLPEVFKRSQAKYKLWWKDHFVCFSPEIFVQIDETGKISSFPMKGTIDASIPNAETTLLNDRKEFYEHTTIVDLIRNDLSSVAEKVWVEKFRYIDKIETHDGNQLLQLSSQVSGLLRSDWRQHLGEIIFGMLPAGSISGAPKNKTIEIIYSAEKETYLADSIKIGKRDFYTGIFGVFDGKTLDTGVMIRFIEQKAGGDLSFKSGGGITSHSIAEKEYKEMIQKIYVPIVRDHTVAKQKTAQSCLS
ncbi:aminodeoxychorismate synthase component I [Emticicia sp. BO119]|uniref:aminodeoxychorismate synthase component I n=1 Tax=Emticicia sp. BO119 TaxID=2757768 RepID=UPI0015EFED03|nr:aminodeoxychorismate synthase component I [Emticicia sp. BO119]MBA4849955.1 aminodeoxychorismate synthase component I [Emticicia sp. BO119]